MKYSTWIGLIVAIIIIAVCFMPWTYHADINKTFTGFFSEQNMYGKPGKFFVIFAVICILLLLINKVWAKRTHIFLAAVMISYAVKTYVLYTSCYNAYCPQVKPGLYILMFACVVMMVIAVLPKTFVDKNKIRSLPN